MPSAEIPDAPAPEKTPLPNPLFVNGVEFLFEPADPEELKRHKLEFSLYFELVKKGFAVYPHTTRPRACLVKWNSKRYADLRAAQEDFLNNYIRMK